MHPGADWSSISSLVGLDISKTKQNKTSEGTVRYWHAALGGVGVTIPEGVQELWKCGTEGH